MAPEVESQVQEPVQPAPAVKPPVPSLADEYELPDSSFDADLDSAEPQATPKAPSAPAPPAAVVAPAPAAPSSKHSVRTLRMAEDFGIPKEDIDAATPEALDMAVYQIHRQILDERSRNQRTAPEAAPAPPATPAAPAPEELDLGLGDVESELHPAILGALNKLKAEVLELRGLKTKIGGMEQREQVRANETMQETLDRHFGKHEAALGKGRGRDLASDSRDFLRRMAVLGIVQRDQTNASLEAKIDRAVTALYGEVAPAPAPAPETPPETPARAANGRFTKEQWAEAGLAKPTHREGSPEPKGTARATKAVATKLKQMDLDDELGDENDEEANLPD